jgi:hypothetical protein
MRKSDEAVCSAGLAQIDAENSRVEPRSEEVDPHKLLGDLARHRLKPEEMMALEWLEAWNEMEEDFGGVVD